MTIKEQKEIFSRNLTYLIEQSGKQQKEIAKDLGISYTTLNTWVRGASMPNTAKIQTLADYFNVLKSDLLDSRMEISETNLERHANLMMAKRYIAYALGLNSAGIVSSLAQLNDDGIREIQKRIDEMLCVPKYKRNDVVDENVYVSVDENGIKKYDSFGREI